MLNSDYRPLCNVDLPYAGRQMYMHTFNLAGITMPKGFEDYFQPVMILCHAAGALSGIAHMTVDEKIVKAGMSQRRPAPHVDGCFIPALNDWGHDNRWAHYCNNVDGKAISRMPVIVAASKPGCRAWKGIFEGMPKGDGDLMHISQQLINGEVLQANVGYLLSPDCVHESMILPVDTQRTFLRIALPVNFPY